MSVHAHVLTPACTLAFCYKGGDLFMARYEPGHLEYDSSIDKWPEPVPTIIRHFWRGRELQKAEKMALTLEIQQLKEQIADLEAECVNTAYLRTNYAPNDKFKKKKILNETQIIEIKKMHDSGVSNRDMAKLFSVSEGTIRNALKS